jgi:hypothetical protein
VVTPSDMPVDLCLSLCQVSKAQVAELVAGALTKLDLAKNKVSMRGSRKSECIHESAASSLAISL